MSTNEKDKDVKVTDAQAEGEDIEDLNVEELSLVSGGVKGGGHSHGHGNDKPKLHVDTGGHNQHPGGGSTGRTRPSMSCHGCWGTRACSPGGSSSSSSSSGGSSSGSSSGWDR